MPLLILGSALWLAGSLLFLLGMVFIPRVGGFLLSGFASFVLGTSLKLWVVLQDYPWIGNAAHQAGTLLFGAGMALTAAGLLVWLRARQRRAPDVRWSSKVRALADMGHRLVEQTTAGH
jgi:membrane-bound ClpP family serine protease